MAYERMDMKILNTRRRKILRGVCGTAVEKEIWVIRNN